MARVYEVFTPGKATELTYVDRQHESVADDLTTMLNRGGKFISVVGPTKMGKTVLVERLATEAVFLQGQSLSNVLDMWRRLGAFYGVAINQTSGLVNSLSLRNGFNAKLKLPVAEFGGDASTDSVHQSTLNDSFEQFPDQILPDLIKDARRAGERVTIVLDDFHFIEESVRRQIIQALKPLAHAGASVVLITLPHRRAEASRLVHDVGGRTETLEVLPWEASDLREIGEKGFAALRLRDPLGIAMRIAEGSYGSPQIAQQLLLELCERVNGITAELGRTKDLYEPEDWDVFWRLVKDDDSSDWIEKLDSGPKSRGTKRKLHSLKGGGSLDGYGVILAALKELGPPLTLRLSDLSAQIDVTLDGPSRVSDIGVSTKLAHMTAIAAKSLDAEVPEVDEQEPLEDVLDPAAGSPQPVFEYDASKETIHILEPYLAYALKWHSDHLFSIELP